MSFSMVKHLVACSLVLFLLNFYVYANVNKVNMGGNLAELADYSYNLVFIDALRTTRKYGSANEPWTPLRRNQYNEDGWPIGTSAGTVVFTDLPAGMMNGTYFFQGDEQLTVGLVASNDCKLVNFAYANGKTTGNIVVGPTATQLMLSFTKSTTTAFQNLRLIRPGFTVADADTQVFLPSFLNEIADLKVLRFMDWCHTNGNPITRWSERAKPSIATYTLEQGVPYEVIIKLANMLNKQVWVNVPAMVDEDYIVEMAKLFKQTLYPSRVFYLEYSNEVWNSWFPQHKYNVQAAYNMVKLQNMTFLNYDNVNNQETWGYRRVGYMATRISDIFAAEYGEDKRNTLFRVVYAGYGAYTYTITDVVTFIEKVLGKPSKYLYAISQAPYFQIDQNDSTEMSVDDILNELIKQKNRAPQHNAYALYVCLTKFHGLKHLAYEGGPDTFGRYNIASKRLASLHPTMKQITIEYLTDWFSYGFDDFLWFQTSFGSYRGPYGTWPWAEKPSDTIHPKKDGIYHMINNPVVPLNSTVYRKIDGVLQSTLSIPAINHEFAPTYPHGYIKTPYTGQGPFYYPIIISKAGYYNVTVETQKVYEGQGYLGVYWNDTKLASLLCNTKTFTFSVPLKSPVTEKGLSVVTLTVDAGSVYNIKTVQVTYVEKKV